jgi:hypothetical protein
MDISTPPLIRTSLRLLLSRRAQGWSIAIWDLWNFQETFGACQVSNFSQLLVGSPSTGTWMTLLWAGATTPVRLNWSVLLRTSS